jgi:hypothetical protein
VRFDGPFAVWSYTVGHGRLLLRRTKSATHPTRVDVLFKNVGWVCLPMNFDGLQIKEAAPGEADLLMVGAGPVRMSDRKVFHVAGSSWKGYVAAGVVVWHEDDHEYDAPSLLLE